MNGDRQLRRARCWGVFWALASVAAGGLLFCCVLPYLQILGLVQVPNFHSFFDPSVAAYNPSPQPFDQAKWDRSHATDRITMGKWLTESGTLIGMSREELVAKLGPAGYESEHEGKTQLTWELGDLDDGGMFIRHMKLLVKIDRSGAVVDAYIYSTD